MLQGMCGNFHASALSIVANFRQCMEHFHKAILRRADRPIGDIDYSLPVSPCAMG